MPQIKRIADGALISVSDAPKYISGIWECGDQRFTDENRDQYESAHVLPVVTPPQFLLLFTSAERVAARAKRATDQTLQDFFALIEDPRLEEVDMNLMSVQNGILYMLQTTSLYDPARMLERQAEILTGVAK